MTHPCGLVYEFLLIVEETASRLGIKGHVAILVRRDLQLNPLITIDFINPDNTLLCRANIPINEKFLIPGQSFDTMKNHIANTFEIGFRKNCLPPDPLLA